MQEIMTGLKIRATAEVVLTAGQWQLFTASMPCVEAADALNKAASEALSCDDPEKAWDIFSAAQNRWAEFGAADSEPSWMFEAMHRRVFGDNA